MKKQGPSDEEILYRVRKILLKFPDLDFNRYVYLSGDYEMRTDIFERARAEPMAMRKAALRAAIYPKGGIVPTIPESQALQHSIGVMPNEAISTSVPKELPFGKRGYHQKKFSKPLAHLPPAEPPPALVMKPLPVPEPMPPPAPAPMPTPLPTPIPPKRERIMLRDEPPETPDP